MQCLRVRRWNQEQIFCEKVAASLHWVHFKTVFTSKLKHLKMQNRLLLFSWINVKYGQADVEQETYFLMGKREKVLGNVFWWKVLWGNFGAGQGRCHKEEKEEERDTTVVRVWWKKPGPVHGSACVFVICNSNQRSHWTELFCHVMLFVQRWRDLAGGSNIVKW